MFNYSSDLLFSNKTNISLIWLSYEKPHVFEYKLWQKIIFSFFMFPIIFFSIVGNILVVLAVVKYPYLRAANNIFLASLAIADCAVGILAAPPNAIQLLSGKWYFKSIMCKFWFSCDVLFSTASILHLCCVSIDRYLSVSNKYTFHYIAEDPTKSWRIRIMIVGVWITSALLSFIPIFTDLYTTKEQADYINTLDYENGLCAFVVNLPYRFISSIVSFWIPAIGLVTCYSLLMKKAYHLETHEFKKYKSLRLNRQSNTQDRKRTIKADSILLSQWDNSVKRDSAVFAKNWRREYRLIKTLGIVITVFMLCWTFFFLRYTLCGPTNSIFPEFICKNLVFEDIVFWIGYFNSMVNPFLYNFTNKDFRRAFRDLLNIRKTNRRDTYVEDIDFRSFSFNNNSIKNNNSKNNKNSIISKKSCFRMESNASSSIYSNSRKTTIDEVQKFI